MDDEIRVSTVEVAFSTVMDSGCRTAYEFWDERRDDEFAPTWRAFELIELPGKIVRYFHVVDIHEDPFDITFRFWGTGLTDVLNFDRTGRSLLTTDMGYFDESRRQQILEDYQKVIDRRVPFTFLWDASSARETSYSLVVPSIRLPISNDGERVTQIATYFDFESRRKEWQQLFEAHKRPFR